MGCRVNIVTIPRTLLLEFLRNPRRPQPFRWPVGVSRHAGHTEWLARPMMATSVSFLLVAADDELHTPAALPSGCVGTLTLGDGRLRGRARGFVTGPSGLEPIDLLRLVGPGMHLVPLSPQGQPDHEDPSGVLERWSRTIGALGLDTWRRLTRLTYGIVGVGRSGSAVVESLAAGLGIERMVLVDPDRTEIHNLGEMVGLDDTNVGHWKAEVMAARLRSPALLRPTVTALNESITHLRSLRAIQDCDVVIGAVDHDGARLATAILATLFCKPYLDIATGIHGTGDLRQMGADIRLTVPDTGTCLLCLGGLADADGARRLLASAEREETFRGSRNWRQERAGSLRSLNQAAASVAVRLWEDFMAERVQQSTWIHLEFDPNGQLALTYPAAAGTRPCPLCRHSGTGEWGIDRMSEIIERRSGRRTPNEEPDLFA
jgi:ThiF family